MLIAIEGIDGAGKGTQARRLSQEFGIDLLSFPDYQSSSGQELWQYLHREGAYADLDDLPVWPVALMYAVNRLPYASKLRQAATGAFDVVCDRYIASSAAHQLRLAPETIFTLENRLLNLPVASCTVFIDTPVDAAIQRLRQSRETLAVDEDDRQKLQAVRERYLTLADSTLDNSRWYRIDGDGSPDDVYARLRAVLSQLRQRLS